MSFEGTCEIFKRIGEEARGPHMTRRCFAILCQNALLISLMTLTLCSTAEARGTDKNTAAPAVKEAPGGNSKSLAGGAASQSRSSPFLGGPNGSPFGRLGPYDLTRPAAPSVWPQLTLGGGARHLEAEGSPTQTQNFARLGAAMNLWQVAIGLELDVILNDEFEPESIFYDDLSDYLSIIKYAEFGSPGQTLHLRSGVIADASIGHGTIVGHYYNNTVLGKPKTGIAGEMNLRVLGVQALLSDVVDLEFSAGRVTYKPIVDTKIPVIRNFTVGTSFAMDRTAPDKVEFNRDGSFQQNSNEEIRASREQLLIYGADLELPIFNNAWLAVIPYADQNFIGSHGNGLHVGVLNRIKLPIHIPAHAQLRGEWRRFTKEYIPTYFDAFYEFERFHYPNVDSPTTKFQSIPGADVKTGYLFELSFHFANMLHVGGVYEENESSVTSRADFYASFTGIDWLILRAHYQKRGFNEIIELGDFDEQSFLSAQALVQIYSFVYADLRWTRYWQIDEDTGQFEAVDIIEPSLALIFQW
jgi:hypothetical protein